MISKTPGGEGGAGRNFTRPLCLVLESAIVEYRIFLATWFQLFTYRLVERGSQIERAALQHLFVLHAVTEVRKPSEEIELDICDISRRHGDVLVGTGLVLTGRRVFHGESPEAGRSHLL